MLPTGSTSPRKAVTASESPQAFKGIFPRSGHDGYLHKSRALAWSPGHGGGGGMKKRRRKVNATGRNETEQFVQIPYTMARHPAWRSLGGAAVKVWVELRSRFNGRNNGELSLRVCPKSL